MLKKIKPIIITMLCMLLMMACGTDKKVEKEAEKIVEAINDNDLSSLESYVTGNGSVDIDTELNDIFSDDTEEDDSGIISEIIKRDNIEIKTIDDNQIVYEVEAPELENIFDDLKKQAELEEDSVENYIVNYISSADVKKKAVEVDYKYEDEKFTADYSNKEFINAITGDFLTAYQNLMQDAINEQDGGE